MAAGPSLGMQIGVLGRSRDDAGFTIMELMVATSIFMIVLSSLLTTLDVASKQERRTAAIVENQNAVMGALAEMTREIRAANPIDISGLPNPADASPLATSLTVFVGSTSGGDRKKFTFAIDAQSRLVETEFRTDGSIVARRVLVERVVNTPAQPLFRYYHLSLQPDGDYELREMDLSEVPATDVQDCAIRVRIEIFAQGEAIAPVYQGSTDVEVRNLARESREGQFVSSTAC